MIDDILVFGRMQEEHDRHLEAVLRRIQAAESTLNREKCEFSTTSVKFLGQLVNATGIQANPDKVITILNMKEPTTISEVRRFLGMANQLCKFTPTLAEKSKPLRDLLSKQNQWIWGDQQKQAFAAIKAELSATPVLALYSAPWSPQMPLHMALGLFLLRSSQTALGIQLGMPHAHSPPPNSDMPKLKKRP